MRIATIRGRVALIDGTGSGAVDVETASGGRLDPEPASVYERWTEFVTWADSASLPPSEALEPGSLGSLSPSPRQVFAIGLNHSARAAESGFARPGTSPPVFTKYPSCITGPWLVTPDEFDDPNDLELGCSITGEQVQVGRTRELIFGVPELIEQLSLVTPLLPGNLVVSGTRGRDANSDPEEER